jgi:hypothetical protein
MQAREAFLDIEAFKLWREAAGLGAARALVAGLIAEMGVDSIHAPSGAEARLASGLGAPGPQSRRTLIVFEDDAQGVARRAPQDLLGRDHLALWLKDFDPAALAAETDAFFALAPRFRLETGLNRYDEIETLCPVMVGMVRF